MGRGAGRAPGDGERTTLPIGRTPPSRQRPGCDPVPNLETFSSSTIDPLLSVRLSASWLPLTISTVTKLLSLARTSSRLLVVISVACLGCSPVAVRSFEPGVEHLPAPGSFHVEGDPAEADRALSVGFFGADNQVASVADDFAAGDQVRIDRTDAPGPHGLIVDGTRCTGGFVVEAGRETDITLRIKPLGCETTVVRVHDEGAVVHVEVTAVIHGFAPIGAEVGVASIDDPPRHAPVSISADESGAFEAGPFPPGRYRLEVRNAGAVLTSVTVELEAGESQFVELRGTPTTPDPS